MVYIIAVIVAYVDSQAYSQQHSDRTDRERQKERDNKVLIITQRIINDIYI